MQPFEIIVDEVVAEEMVSEITVDVLDRIGQFIVDEIYDNISVIGPPHSLPGEYPRYITGELANSLFFQVIDGVLYIGNDAPHAEKVEGMRPHVVRTFEEIKSDIRNIV